MKKLNFIFLLLSIILIGLFGCKKEYVPPVDVEFSDGVASKTGESVIPVGDTITFVDLSQGVANRSWGLPDGARFLQLEEGVDPGSAQIVKIEFNKPGEFEVSLNVDLSQSETDFDTTFMVEVLDSVTASIDVINIESNFIEESDAQITIYEGGAITFADSSNGDANRRKWLFPGGNPEEAGGISAVEDEKVIEVKVQYSTIGVFDVVLISSRENPYGRPDTLIWEDFVNVVKNEEPPQLVGIAEDAEDSTLHITYNLPMKVTGDVIANFSLMVDGSPMDIQKVSINPDNNQMVDVLPALNIFHTSEVSLSYDGMGGVSRINDVPAPAFTEEPVSLDLPPNVLEAAGISYDFEAGGDPAGWDIFNFEPANTNPATNNSGLSAERTSDAHTGNGALVFHLNENEDLAAGEKNNARFTTDFVNFPMTFEAGKSYRMEFWYKIEGVGGQEFTTRIHAGGGWAPAPGGGWSPGGETDGWTFRTINWNAPIDAEILDGRISMQFISKDNNTKADVFIDDILIYAVD